MKTATWKGDTTIRQQPDSGRFKRNSAGETYVLIYGGLYETLLGRSPQIGSSMADAPTSSFFVADVDVVRSKGGKGLMTVTCQYDTPGSSLNAVVGEYVTEIEWVNTEMPLARNKRYLPGGTMELAADDFQDIAAWEHQSRPPLSKMAGKWADGSDDTSPEVKDYIGKFLKGEEAFRASYPVIRATRSYGYQVRPTKCDVIVAPPTAVNAPPGYQWLKTADRVIKTGKHGRWVRYEEWTGAIYIDTDLYDSSSSLDAMKKQFCQAFRLTQKALGIAPAETAEK